MDWDSSYIRELIRMALMENAAPADLSVTLITPTEARVIADQDFICAGLPLAERVFLALDPEMRFVRSAGEGQRVRSGGDILRLAGKAVAILSGERVALNFLRHLSGIATVTRKFVDIAGTDAKISATPETTPGLRLLDVYAMEMGGGIAYRGNAIRLNRNHIALAGGVKAALDQAHAFVSSQMNPPEMTAYEAVGAVPSNGEASSLSVQIEVRSESELREALSAGVEWVSLQAMGLSEARECVSIAREMRPDCVVEISGGITLENAHRYVESGADYLSPSGLIGSVPKAEVRLLVENQ